MIGPPTDSAICWRASGILLLFDRAHAKHEARGAIIAVDLEHPIREARGFLDIALEQHGEEGRGEAARDCAGPP